MPVSFLIVSEETVFMNIYIDGPDGGSGWQTVTSGTAVEVKLHSENGMDYLRLIHIV